MFGNSLSGKINAGKNFAWSSFNKMGDIGYFFKVTVGFTG